MSKIEVTGDMQGIELNEQGIGFCLNGKVEYQHKGKNRFLILDIIRFNYLDYKHEKLILDSRNKKVKVTIEFVDNEAEANND